MILESIITCWVMKYLCIQIHVHTCSIFSIFSVFVEFFQQEFSPVGIQTNGSENFRHAWCTKPASQLLSRSNFTVNFQLSFLSTEVYRISILKGNRHDLYLHMRITFSEKMSYNHCNFQNKMSKPRIDPILSILRFFFYFDTPVSSVVSTIQAIGSPCLSMYHLMHPAS